jgi:alpha-L-fucosidase
MQPDGAVDDGARTMLVQMGQWMKVNGEGIYGSHAWVKYGEGPLGPDGKMKGLPMGALNRPQAEYRFGPGDFRFTQGKSQDGKDGAVYVFALETPKPGDVVKVMSMGTKAGLLKSPVTEVTLLGSTEKLKWTQGEDALEITYPEKGTMDGKDMTVVFRVR